MNIHLPTFFYFLLTASKAVLMFKNASSSQDWPCPGMLFKNKDSTLLTGMSIYKGVHRGLII